MNPDIPEVAQRYLNVVKDRQDHPFMRHFHQVTWLAVPNAEHGDVEFFVLEFRMRDYAVLAWLSTAEKWVAGSWVKLAHRGADITCPPTPVTVAYLTQAQAYPSLDAALGHLAASVPVAPSAWQTIKNALRGIFRR